MALLAVAGLLALPAIVTPAVEPEAGRGFPPAPPQLPPSLPKMPTPADRLRALLALDAAGRETALTNRTPVQRDYLRARLLEFDALTPAEREFRLQLLDLQHHLVPLLRLEGTNRVEALRRVPLSFREPVADRLAAWDRLPAGQRAEMLQHEKALVELPFWGGGTPDTQQARLEGMAPERRRTFEADLQRWQLLSQDDRTRLTQRFQSFLALNEVDKARTLSRLDEPQRQRAERLLAALNRLPAGQRAQFLEAFRRFAALPPVERQRFLDNAARWKAMSVEERQAWRQVTSRLPPPPPGLDGTPPLPPPPPNVPARYSRTNAQAAR